MLYRKSKQRERVLQVIRETRVHPTADWVYMRLKDQIPGLSLGTVYRNLKVLIEQGQILKLPFGSTFDRFEAKIEPHYHLVCDQCGTVEDFTMPHPVNINKKAEELCDFKINRHRIDFFGICKKCQNKAKQPSKRKGK